MGKTLVVKGADFSGVAIAQVNLTPIPIPEDITNLFTWVEDKCVVRNGKVSPTLYYKVCGYVDVSEYTKIRLVQPMYRVGPVTNSFPSICFYDANNVCVQGELYNLSDIDGQPSTEIVEHSVPAGAKYVRTNYWLDSYKEQYPNGHYIDFVCYGIR